MNLPTCPMEPLNQLTQHTALAEQRPVLRGGGTLSWSKGFTRFRSVSLFTEPTASHAFTLSPFCSLKLNEWMHLPPSRPARGSTESHPLTIIYEAVCLLKLTRCCLLALLVQRITECFIQYLSNTAGVMYKWCQICLPKKMAINKILINSLGRPHVLIIGNNVNIKNPYQCY